MYVSQSHRFISSIVIITTIVSTGCSLVAGAKPESTTPARANLDVSVAAPTVAFSTESQPVYAGATMSSEAGPAPAPAPAATQPSSSALVQRQAQVVSRPGARLSGPLRPLAAGMTFVAPACRAGASEECNGVDDDCNGQIDEGCASFQTGTLQLTLSYDSDAEIYMTVHSPVGGHRVSRNESDVQSGGTFQAPRARRCTFERVTDRMENAVYTGERMPRGTYRVDVSFYSTCGNDQMRSANLQVAIAFGGRNIGSYRWVEPHDQFGRNAPHAVLEFDVE